MRLSRLRDDVADVLIELSARRARALLLLLGVALSTGVLDASYTLSTAAARQVDSGLAAAGSTVMTVGVRQQPDDAEPAVGEAADLGDGASGAAAGIGEVSVFPADTEQRAQRVQLVLAAGRSVEVSRDDARPRRLAGDAPAEVDVLGVTSHYLRAARAGTGSAPTWMLDGTDPRPVALVGGAAADRLGIPDGVPAPGVRLWVGDQAFDVVGRLTEPAGNGLDNVVLIPYSTALGVDGVSESRTVVLVRTDLGGGAPVSRVIREAILPEAPATLVTSSVADFGRVRADVGSELGRLTVAIGLLLLGVSTLIIANAMVVSVVSRTAEIGLRRSLGASQADVARVFLIEGGLVGLLGGLLGAGAGMATSVVVATVNQWDAAQPLLAALVGPIVGLVAGVVASAYPAWRAATVQPADAMRSD
ncbi:MAG: ABC transporter permease [Dermatophilaceae bacterium]